MMQSFVAFHNCLIVTRPSVKTTPEFWDGLSAKLAPIVWMATSRILASMAISNDIHT